MASDLVRVLEGRRSIKECTVIDQDGKIVPEKTRYFIGFGGDFGADGLWQCYAGPKPNGFASRDEAELYMNDDEKLVTWHSE